MPAFHYIALNQTGKELSGVIEAENDAAARKNLNNLGLSVVSLELGSVTTPGNKSENKTVFEFEGRDKNARKISGTIVAETPSSAFARLFEEYELSVTSLIPADVSDAEKNAIKKNGVTALQQEYENTAKKKAVIEDDSANNASEKRELLEQIELTMRRVETFLTSYGTEMKDEERDVIQGYMNQLIRIKDSTNLDHIRATCEKMLSHIQKKELFLHEEGRLKESARMKMETQAMLSQLKRTGLQQDIDIVKTASHWREHPFLKPLADFVLRLFGAKNPEVQKLRTEIRAVKLQMWTSLKLLIIGKSSVVRSEAWESLKHLREEKKRLLQNLHALRREDEREKNAEAGRNADIFAGTSSLLGWLLSFYLVIYIVGFPFSVKQLDLFSLPKGFYFYHSTFTRYVTLFLFFVYIAVSIRRFWLQESRLAPLWLYPASVFAFLLLAINLL